MKLEKWELSHKKKTWKTGNWSGIELGKVEIEIEKLEIEVELDLERAKCSPPRLSLEWSWSSVVSPSYPGRSDR